MNLHEEYWANLEQGEFKIRRCNSCSKWQFPAMTRCQHCLGEDLSWQTPSGKGQVWSWIKVHKPYFKEYADEVPYLVAMIKLEEGPLMISSLTDVKVPVVKCGTPVSMVIKKGRGGKPMPYFQMPSGPA